MRNRREAQTQRELVEANLYPRVGVGHLVVAAERENAPSGDRVAIDRRHNGLGQRQRRQQELIKHQHEPTRVFGTIFDQAEQIDTGRERRAGARDDHVTAV